MFLAKTRTAAEGSAKDGTLQGKWNCFRMSLCF